MDKKFRLKDKFNFSKVKILKICAYTLCLIASIALLAGFNFQPFAAAVNSRKIPIYCVDRSDNKVAITFDAAWGADKTQKILDVCHRYGVKATFFLVGFWIDNYPDMVKKIDEMGHTIGTHSETHPKMGSLSAEKITQELSSSMKKITDLTGKEVKLFRAPFGDYSNRLLEVILDNRFVKRRAYYFFILNQSKTCRFNGKSIFLRKGGAQWKLKARPQSERTSARALLCRRVCLIRWNELQRTRTRIFPPLCVRR